MENRIDFWGGEGYQAKPGSRVRAIGRSQHLHGSWASWGFPPLSARCRPSAGRRRAESADNERQQLRKDAAL